MAQQRIAGIAYVKVDGRQYETSGTLTINPGQPMREGILGTSRIAGFAEKPQIPSIEAKVLLTRDFKLLDLANLEGVTVTVVGPNGSTFILRDAYTAGDVSYSTENAEVSLKFEGLSMDEVAAA
ncbi:MAG: phage tail tube protein [Planctomycetota bacterium]